LLTQDIEDIFSAKKAGPVFVDLTAAYDTVWHHGIYTSYMPIPISTKCAYIDDQAIIHVSDGWQAVEGVPNKVWEIVGKYLQSSAQQK